MDHDSYLSCIRTTWPTSNVIDLLFLFYIYRKPIPGSLVILTRQVLHRDMKLVTVLRNKALKCLKHNKMYFFNDQGSITQMNRKSATKYCSILYMSSFLKRCLHLNAFHGVFLLCMKNRLIVVCNTAYCILV